MCGPDLLSFEQWKAPPQGGAFGDVAGAGGAVMTSCSCPSPCFHDGPVGVLRRALAHLVMCGWSWGNQCLWNPDRGGVIPQTNSAAIEVFDADPGADQAVEHVFHRFE